MNSALRGEALRFLIAGGVNTLVTYALYLLLLRWWPYGLAYTTSFLTGIVSSYVLSTRFVFGVGHSVKRMALYPMVYGVQYLVGLAVLYIAVRQLGVPQRWALLASIAVTVPLTFVLSRLVLKHRQTEPSPAPDRI